MPSIERFREFLVLAEHLNYSAAAETLFITQSALSRHIVSLENELGSRLFDRDTQSVALTPTGELFQKRISALVEKYDDICSEMRTLRSGYINRLRISCPYYAIHDYLGPMPEIFECACPDVKLEYHVGDPNEAMQNLLDDKADLAIIPKYQVPRSGELISHFAFTEPLGVLLPQKHPLAAKSEISLCDLKNETFFSVGNNYFNASWRHVASLCKTAGFTPSDPALFNQMEALIIAIRRGDGVAVIGHHMRNQESDLVAYRPLSDADCLRQVCIWHKKDKPNPTIDKFIRIYSSATFNRHSPASSCKSELLP